MVNQDSESRYATTSEGSLNTEISRNLVIINKKLDQATQGTEKDILAIGSKLQTFLVSSQNIASHSSQTIESISKDILETGVAELNVLILNFSSSLGKSADALGSNKDKLSIILESVNNIVDGFQGFRRIIKQLKMLGISTKIETSRLGTDDKGFNTIADNVDRLAQLIDAKVSMIEAKAKLITAEIVKTTNDLLLLEKEQRHQSNLIVDHTMGTLKLFEEKHNDYLLKTDTIKNDATAIYTSIRNIVTSIQFHDITRQQIEHVSEALSEAQNVLTEKSGEGAEDEEYQLGKVYDICSLQSEQIVHARDEFSLAVSNIIDELYVISKSAGDILETAMKLSEEFGKSGTSFGNIETDLLDILKALMKNSEISWRLLDSTKSVISTIEELTSSIQQIEEIGTEIELIALNARVRAAHTGANGASLGVLAEAIQKLSVDAKKQTEMSTGLLTAIGSISNTLEMELDKFSEDNSSTQVNNTHELIKELLSNISSKGVILTGRIEDLTRMVQQLEREISHTASGIHVHEHLQMHLNDAITMLARINQEISSVTTFVSDRHRNTGHLSTKYTMHSERLVHGKYTGAVAKTRSVVKSKTPEEQLDDNIELF
ncbi:MAG: methyl-accepting chemotaxis protein [Ignavibacteriales bacterium]|nr:methyl-accepting chemotaxis protein [Ignavibacteriales bacterium]